MTRRQAEVLRAAALRGVPQLKGVLRDGRGGYCALGLLEAAGCASGLSTTWLSSPQCPECGATRQTHHRFMSIGTESELIIHLNNDHGMDFAGIANKLEVVDAS